MILKTRWQRPIKHLCSGVCNSVLRHDYEETKKKNRKADDCRFCIFIWERRYAEIPPCHQLCSVFRHSLEALCYWVWEMLSLWIDIGLGARVTESRQLKQICNRRDINRYQTRRNVFLPPVPLDSPVWISLFHFNSVTARVLNSALQRQWRLCQSDTKAMKSKKKFTRGGATLGSRRQHIFQHQSDWITWHNYRCI